MPAIIAVSGNAYLYEEDLFSSGANALFDKPFDFKKLQNSLNLLLGPRAEQSQRRYPRLRSSFSASLARSETKWENQARVLSFCQGGFFAYFRSNLPEKDEILSFEIDCGVKSEPKIYGVGVVRWSRGLNSLGLASGCGVEFLHLAGNDLERVISITQSKLGSFER